MSSIERKFVLDVPIDVATFEQVLQTLLDWRQRRERRYVVVTNPHSILTCHRDAAMMEATRNAPLVLADGVGATLALRTLYDIDPPRTPGPELMLYLIEAGQALGLRHYLYGGKPAVLETLQQRLSARFPKAIFCGSYSPPFRALSPEEDEEDVARISATKPDFVWVGLGAPKQEKWMASHAGRVDATAMFGVGAAFDYHADQVHWAPTWVRRAGVEWAYRFVQEPRRLWRRNLDSPMFAARVLAQKLGFGASAQSR